MKIRLILILVIWTNSIAAKEAPKGDYPTTLSCVATAGLAFTLQASSDKISIQIASKTEDANFGGPIELMLEFKGRKPASDRQKLDGGLAICFVRWE